MSDGDKQWAKRVAKELDLAKSRGRVDAKRRSVALAASYRQREQHSIRDYQLAVKLAAVTKDTVFLSELQQAAAPHWGLAECVADWAELPDLHDPVLVEFAEAIGPVATSNLMALRKLLQEVIDQVREDPVSIIDLVKAAADDPTLKLVLEVVVSGDRELEGLARAAEEALAVE